jgi:hypothetical protein
VTRWEEPRGSPLSRFRSWHLTTERVIAPINAIGGSADMAEPTELIELSATFRDSALRSVNPPPPKGGGFRLRLKAGFGPPFGGLR